LFQLAWDGDAHALTILAAIGPIERFEDAKHLVGYAGLGARFMTAPEPCHRTYNEGGTARSPLRHGPRQPTLPYSITPNWKKEFERLEFRLGRSKAIVAIARHLLIAAWHILKKETLDRHADVDNGGRLHAHVA